MDYDIHDQDSLKAKFLDLYEYRDPYLRRARTCSALTLPSLIVPEGHTASSSLPTPYQALGARGVNNLAARLLLTLLPPNQPLFKLILDDKVRQELGAAIGEAEKALNKMERIVLEDIETSHTRPAIFEGLKHLLIAGNVLSFESPEGNTRMYPLTRYVVQRYPNGKPRQLVLQEMISLDAVPESLRLQALADGRLESHSKDKTTELYTGVYWDTDGRSEVHQEIFEIRVEGSEGSYPKNLCPWNPLRMILVEGEDYGRSYVEEFIGDLKSLEALTMATVHAASAAAKVIFLNNPNGNTDTTDFEEAIGGDVIEGDTNDISVVQVAKGSDFNFVENRIMRLTESLSYVFLLNSAIQRNAERVTAEEIRYMANELEAQLGGIYSAMSQEFQLPLVRVRMARLTKQKKLPRLPDGAVEPAIVTGVDAIGRGNDFQKLNAFIQFLTNSIGPQAAVQYINNSELANRAAAGIGIDSDGLVKTEEQLRAEAEAAQQAQQQQAQQQLAMQAVGPAINQSAESERQAQQQPPQ